MLPICASAPAKLILFGEHAVNRGQSALATSFGRRATVRLAPPERLGRFTITGGGQRRDVERGELLAFATRLAQLQAAEQYEAIQALGAEQGFFAPILAVLGALGDALPAGLTIAVDSAIPIAVGMGSGGAVFVALAAGLAHLAGHADDRPRIAGWARQGDVVAHGGVASGLDTQTSLYGGVIRYSLAAEAEPVPCAPGLALVVGNTGVVAATSAVNQRVRLWLAADPARHQIFVQIGELARQAEGALARGDWPELGRLMHANQILLGEIGVSCPEIDRLNAAARAAGAYGAKLAGSGGGGIMIALVDAERGPAVAAAITAAGGAAILAPVGVPGVYIQ